MQNEPCTIVKAAFLFLSLQTLLIQPLQAQRDSTSAHAVRRFDYDQIYSTNHWNLFLRPSVIFAPVGDAYFSHGPTWFKMESSPMVTFGWVYEINLQDSWRRKKNNLSLSDRPRIQHPLNRWGIQTGLSMQLYWLNFNYSIPQSYSGLNQYFGAPQKFQTENVLQVPIYGVYRLPFNDRHHSWLATFKAGVDINIQPSYEVDYGDYGLASVPAFQLTQLSHPGKEYFVYPSIHASAGINYILPNKKMLNLQIVGNYSPFYKEVTNFSFLQGTAQQWSGSSTRTLSYAGVELNYIFTKVRRMRQPGEGYTYLTRVEKKLRAAGMYPYDTVPLRKRHYDLPTIFSTNHTYFTFQVNIIPFHVPFHNALVKFYSQPDLGYMGGWMYQINFKHRWGLETGIQGEFNQENYHFFLPKNYTGLSANLPIVYGNAAVAGVNIPVYACYYVPIPDRNDRWLANFKLGVDLKFGSDINTGGEEIWTFTDPVSQKQTTVLTLSEYRSSKTNFYNSFYASAGINYVLPNKKMLNFQVVGNYSPFFQKTFQYSIMPGTPQEIDGSFKRSYSYIGFELNYILTNPSHMKKIKKQ